MRFLKFILILLPLTFLLIACTVSPTSQTLDPNDKAEDYLFCTFGEITQKWGADFNIGGNLIEGFASGIYYEDCRTPFIFVFNKEPHALSDSDTVQMVRVRGGNGALTDKFRGDEPAGVLTVRYNLFAGDYGAHSALNESSGYYAYTAYLSDEITLVYYFQTEMGPSATATCIEVISTPENRKAEMFRYNHYLTEDEINLLYPSSVEEIELQEIDSSPLIVRKENAIGSVSLSIRCDEANDKSPAHIPDDGIILQTSVIDILDGDTVLDVLIRVSEARSFSFITTEDEKNGLIILGINYIFAQDYNVEKLYPAAVTGKHGAWIYDINGQKYIRDLDRLILQDGDNIEIYLVADTKEIVQ